MPEFLLVDVNAQQSEALPHLIEEAETQFIDYWTVLAATIAEAPVETLRGNFLWRFFVEMYFLVEHSSASKEYHSLVFKAEARASGILVPKDSY